MDQDAPGKLSSSACGFCTHLPDRQSSVDDAQQMDHTGREKIKISLAIVSKDMQTKPFLDSNRMTK